jgi:hypothetical protein
VTRQTCKIPHALGIPQRRGRATLPHAQVGNPSPTSGTPRGVDPDQALWRLESQAKAMTRHVFRDQRPGQGNYLAQVDALLWGGLVIGPQRFSGPPCSW